MRRRNNDVEGELLGEVGAHLRGVFGVHSEPDGVRFGLAVGAQMHDPFDHHQHVL